MPLSLYQATVPPFIRSLKMVSTLLEKGRSQFPDEETRLLESRLIDDMAALPFQIQRLSDSAKGLAVRLGRAEPIVMADDETTFPELQSRIERTIAILEAVDPNSMDGREDDKISVTPTITYTGLAYVQDFVIPNFYFHVCMTYAILRKAGVTIGKKDYLAPPSS